MHPGVISVVLASVLNLLLLIGYYVVCSSISGQSLDGRGLRANSVINISSSDPCKIFSNLSWWLN